MRRLPAPEYGMSAIFPGLGVYKRRRLVRAIKFDRQETTNLWHTHIILTMCDVRI